MDTVTIKASEEIRGFMSQYLKPFEPCAYFDKHLDCIRVVIADETSIEERLNEFFTIHRAAPQSRNEFVGFTIKGVVNLFNRIGLPSEGVHHLVEILDTIAKKLPHTAEKRVREQFISVLNDKKLTVDLARAA